MNLSFRKIDKDNFDECVNLKVAPSQKYFVAPNVGSLAQAYVNPSLHPFAIYDHETMVGFTMYSITETQGERYYYITRLMIGENHQGKGYGRAAMKIMLEMLKKKVECPEIRTSYVEENVVVEKLYLSLGFRKDGRINEHHERVGEDEESEILLRLPIGQS